MRETHRFEDFACQRCKAKKAQWRWVAIDANESATKQSYELTRAESHEYYCSRCLAKKLQLPHYWHLQAQFQRELRWLARSNNYSTHRMTGID